MLDVVERESPTGDGDRGSAEESHAARPAREPPQWLLLDGRVVDIEPERQARGIVGQCRSQLGFAERGQLLLDAGGLGRATAHGQQVLDRELARVGAAPAHEANPRPMTTISAIAVTAAVPTMAATFGSGERARV